MVGESNAKAAGDEVGDGKETDHVPREGNRCPAGEDVHGSDESTIHEIFRVPFTAKEHAAFRHNIDIRERNLLCTGSCCLLCFIGLWDLFTSVQGLVFHHLIILVGVREPSEYGLVHIKGNQTLFSFRFWGDWRGNSGGSKRRRDRQVKICVYIACNRPLG